jgi:hypothetical protein
VSAPKARDNDDGLDEDVDGLGVLSRHSGKLLVFFCACLVALNVWRLPAWGPAGFEVYLTHAIMQTTLFDFGAVLAILLVFIHQDAKRLGLSYWWIVPTFPFMPTIGLLLYFVVRERTLQRRAAGATSAPQQA